MTLVMVPSNLSDAERRVGATPRGELVGFRAGDTPAGDPSTGESWDRERQARAEVRRGLAGPGDEGAART